jgi:hypothetical protein
MMRLRQIALVGADLAAAKAEITQVLGLGADYLDKGVRKFGLVNAVWPVGDTFLEVVSPAEPGTTAGRLMDKRGGDGGYMVILQVDDGLAARARAVGLGVRLVEQAEFKGVVMTHFHPRDVGGAILSVDQMTPPERWEWGGPDWEANVRTEVSTGIHAYGVAHHRHGPEIEQELSRAAGQDLVVAFTPHLMPMNRGILSTIYVQAAGGAKAADLRACLAETYSNERFVKVYPRGMPELDRVQRTNECHMAIEQNGDTIVMVSVIDNLLKGASGQALQNMNLMLGLEETAGLA